MINFDRFHPRVLVGFFYDFLGYVADGFIRKVVLMNLEFSCWLFEYDGGHGNLASFFAINDVSARGVAKPRCVWENAFQDIPNRFQFFLLQLFGMDLEAYSWRTVFFAPIAKIDKFLFKCNRIVKRKNPVFHFGFPFLLHQSVI